MARKIKGYSSQKYPKMFSAIVGGAWDTYLREEYDKWSSEEPNNLIEDITLTVGGNTAVLLIVYRKPVWEEAE